MRAREPFDDILIETLSKGWSEQFGREVTVRPGVRRGSQVWYEHRLFSAYVTADVGPKARHYLRDGFRWTPKSWRAPLQWVAGTAAGTSLGSRLSSVPAFSVDPPIEGADELVVLPGNLRIRTLDFRRRRVRTIAKAGFSADPMRNEIEVRAILPQGLAPAIEACGEAKNWFEEALLDGATLPRVVDSHRRVAIAGDALARVESALRPTVREREAAGYVGEILEEIHMLVARLRGSSLEVRRRLLTVAERFAAAAEPTGTVQCARTHGDLQPGNVFVLGAGNESRILDWEHSRVRIADYDRYVLEFGSRGAAIRAQRKVAHVPLMQSRIAYYLLEDLRFHLEESALGPYGVPPDPLLDYAEYSQIRSG